MRLTDADLVELISGAFHGRVSSCRHTCECGITYWDNHNQGYDWNDGELDALAANPKAKPVPHAVGIIEFEGRHYADGCTCWHPRAIRIATFLVDHDEAIADFLRARRRLLQDLADGAAVVEGGG